MWQLNGTTDEDRDEQATFLKQALENLKSTISEIDSLTVHRNCAYHETNFDLTLVSEFANLAALETYIEHPDHQAVVVEVKKRVSARAAIDFAI
jgi:quinol monooxygenase YgiN